MMRIVSMLVYGTLVSYGFSKLLQLQGLEQHIFVGLLFCGSEFKVILIRLHCFLQPTGRRVDPHSPQHGVSDHFSLVTIPTEDMLGRLHFFFLKMWN